MLNGSQQLSPLGRRRLLTGLAVFGLGVAGRSAARAAPLPFELAQPAVVSPLAAFGLFNAIVPAGPRLVAVGERGRILLSDDAGQSWAQAPVPVSVTLIAAQFATPQIGYVTGQMGVVLKTTDAGKSWTKVLDGTGAAAAMLAEANADNAKLTPAALAALNDEAANNGTSTELQNAQLLATVGPANPLLCLVVADENHVLVFGAFGLALETLDGGATWSGIASRVPNPQDSHIYSAINLAGTLVLGGEQGFLMTGPLNGTLTPVTSPFSGSLFGFTAADNHLLAYGVQGTVLVSGNQGTSWIQTPAPSGNGILSGLHLSDQRIVLGDESGNLLITPDAGQHFAVHPANAPVTALAQAADGALVIGSPMGLRRLPLGLLGA